MTSEEQISATGSRASPSLQRLFAAVVFVSSFLLFQVQPLIAKILVPWFGGSAGVWTTALMFFQVMLLAGYFYAHWLSRQAWKVQVAIHSSLLALSFAVLPIRPSQAWKPTGAQSPIPVLLEILAATIGLPYLMLSATSPLLQSWYSKSKGSPLPWRFFALSNFGSLAGLLLYPLAVEPFLTNHQQSRYWSVAYVAFAALCIAAAFGSRVGRPIKTDAPQSALPAPALMDKAWWFVLAMLPSALMMATTGHLTQNVAAVPFLWVPPLALYLISLMACFDSDRWYNRGLFARLSVLALIAMAWAMRGFANLQSSIFVTVLLFCTTLFILFMTFHGELSRRKPHSAFLTTFYLVVAAGGAAGGILVGLIAPVLFNALYELPLLLVFSSVALLTLLWKARQPSGFMPDFFGTRAELTSVLGLAGLLGFYVLLRTVDAFVGLDRLDFIAWIFGGAVILWLLAASRRRAVTRSAAIAATVFVTALTAFLGHEQAFRLKGAVELSRNFYGALMVSDTFREPVGMVRELRNGTITHGEQILSSKPEIRRLPTTYYAPDSGVGLALDALMKEGPLVVGMVGLGAGTITAFGRSEDRYVAYEINPNDVRVASSYFSFMPDSPAQIEIVAGDARLSMENESPRGFDLLALDAFSGDSIPVHLLTEEAFSLYWRHLKPDGILAVHISNQFLDLKTVVRLAADHFSKSAMEVLAPEMDARRQYLSEWVLMSSRKGFFESATILKATRPVDLAPGSRMWTDNYSNLFQVLR